ncbi:MAG: CopG family transcriptional regulator [Armatimonadetes bacterium]|nr:CopG family transcriptional regulator [Armatimonadota bacterium]NIM24424.1 CopG family transcriptional regulator [Armatimonadota bacterium]NIM68295.1 CopG family transcriptional regulator [Armatimonadota bacterium]NIM76699.1 CopG family transcriptional regulator [Armatimonadota bacterium]NIN06498.1 CopG family transcriptional regulator [Armatimonadota bacterium]
MGPEPADMVTLKIPRPLYERLKQLIEGTGFRSVTEFAIYVLRDLSSNPAAAAGEQEDKEAVSRMTVAELKAIRDRLKELGYL